MSNADPQRPKDVEEDDTSDTSEGKFDSKTMFGRIYQTYSIDNQVNLDPVDETEEERLRLQHELLKMIFANRKDALLPDTVQDPGDILDCGFGAGDWAIEVAETHPDCNVVGIDISPILIEQSERPENFSPQIADLNISEESFGFRSDSFDFVSSRFVSGGLAQLRWPSYVTDIRRVLRRGGSAEMIEWDIFFRSDSGNGDRLAALRQWSQIYLHAISSGQGTARKSRSIPPDLESMMRVSGFVNVSANVIDVPVSPWSSDPNLYEIGKQNQMNVEQMLTSMALYPVVGRGMMSEADLRDLIVNCIKELKNTSSEPYIRLYVCFEYAIEQDIKKKEHHEMKAKNEAVASTHRRKYH